MQFMLSQRKTVSLKLKVTSREELSESEETGTVIVQVYGLLPGESDSMM